MGGFKMQLQLTNVSQENLLFCPLSLFAVHYFGWGHLDLSKDVSCNRLAAQVSLQINITFYTDFVPIN